MGYHDNNERDEWIDVRALRILITRTTIPMLPPVVPHAVLHGAEFSSDVAGDGPSEQALANALRQLRDGATPLSREIALNQVQRLVGFQPKHVSHQAVDAVCQRLLTGAELAASPLPPPPHVNRSSFYNWHARIVDTSAVQASLALLDLSERAPVALVVIAIGSRHAIAIRSVCAIASGSARASPIGSARAVTVSSAHAFAIGSVCAVATQRLGASQRHRLGRRPGNLQLWAATGGCGVARPPW